MVAEPEAGLLEMRYSVTFSAWALAGYLPDGILTESIEDITMGETLFLLSLLWTDSDCSV